MTPKRRQYGTGGLSQRSSDGMWIGTIEAGWTAKGRRRITVSAKTQAECKKKLERKRAQIKRDGIPDGISVRATVRSWCHEWLGRKRETLKPTSMGGYTSAVNAWIIPTIGKVRLSDLTPGHVRAVAKAVTTAGGSPTHARGVQAILQRALKAAIADGHPVPERLLLVEPPAPGISDRTAIPTEQAINMLAAAAELPGGSRWAAAFLQGMRQSECLGLTWDRVDLDAGTIDVSWQLQSIPWAHGCTFKDGKPTCGHRFARGCHDKFHDVPTNQEVVKLERAFHLTRPKTSSGFRIIPLVPWMVESLRAWQEVAPVSPHGLVWPRSDGRPQPHKEDQRAWLRLQEKAGARHPADRSWDLHEARHCTATLLLEAGVDPETVKAILGHSDIATSRSYQHVSTALARQAMEKVAEKLQLVQRQPMASSTPADVEVSP